MYLKFKHTVNGVNAGELGPRGKLGPNIRLNEIWFFLLLQ